MPCLTKNSELIWKCRSPPSGVRKKFASLGSHIPNLREFSSLKLVASCLNRLVQWFAEKLDVKLNKFIMDDLNTFYLVNEQLKRTYGVKADPDILKYELPEGERGKSAEQLLQEALQKVWRDEEGISGPNTVQYIVRVSGVSTS